MEAITLIIAHSECDVFAGVHLTIMRMQGSQRNTANTMCRVPHQLVLVIVKRVKHISSIV